MNDDYQILPGLYAAGNDANSIYDTTYVPLAGNYMGFAVNTGRIAAESALAYLKRSD
jgi:fumarate reductase flavoprotein subunit